MTHLNSQMHTRRWTNPPLRFIDLRRPAADRSAVPPTTDQTISASAGCLTSNKLRGRLIKTRTGGLFCNKGTSRHLVWVARFLIGYKMLCGLICRRTISWAEHSSPFMLLPSAHTKHSSPPPPPTTHTNTHTHTLFLFLPFPPSNTLHVRE